jgi:hypothetical protein
VHAEPLRLTPTAVRRYYESVLQRRRFARQLSESDHGDNSLYDDDGKPVGYTGAT